jgi:hypothetical protein
LKQNGESNNDLYTDFVEHTQAGIEVSIGAHKNNIIMKGVH